MRVKTDMSRRAAVATRLPPSRANVPTPCCACWNCKAAAAETANEVLDLAMRVCGGAAFRKEVGVERYFRDARAAGIMAPTTDVLYDFIGKAVCGMPLF